MQRYFHFHSQLITGILRFLQLYGNIVLTHCKYEFYPKENQFIGLYYMILIFLHYLILLFFKCNYFNYFCLKDKNSNVRKHSTKDRTAS